MGHIVKGINKPFLLLPNASCVPVVASERYLVLDLDLKVLWKLRICILLIVCEAAWARRPLVSLP